MDPIVKFWMFENWLEDQKEVVELAKNSAYLLGSFWNPELVKKLTGNDGKTIKLSDEEFERNFEMIQKSREVNKESKKRKRRRKIK